MPTEPVIVKGWSYRFKVSKGFLLMERKCEDAGLCAVDEINYACWPYAVRSFQVEESLRGMNVPAKARKIALSIIP